MATFTVTTLDDELDNIDTLGTISIANFGGLNDISLREAIALAKDAAGDDDIDFDAALASGTIILSLGELQIDSGGSLTINGDTDGDGKADITVSGDDSSRIFNVDVTGETVSFESLTLTDASDITAGGAIFGAPGSTIELLNSTIRDSDSSAQGGGIFGETLVIANSTFVNNEGSSGGGIAVGPNGSGTITNTTIDGNTATTSTGGGIYAAPGAGLSIYSSTITGNVAETSGSAILIRGGSPLTIHNSVIADNTVNLLGGEIIAELGGLATITVGNTFFDGTAFDFAITNDLGGNIIDEGGDPGLDPLADNGGVVETRAIQDGSPLLEAGSETLLPTEVQAGLDVDGDGTIENTVIDVDGRGAGFDRDVDSDGVPPTPDIGAFEVQLAADFVVTTNLDEAFDGGDLAAELADGDGLSLREALGLANFDPSTLDTITFDAGEFAGGLDSLIRLDAVLGELVISGQVSIDGSTGTDVVITGDTAGDDDLESGTFITDVDASAGSLVDNVRVLNITSVDATTTLNDLTITGGYTTAAGDDGSGAGIRTLAELTVTNSTISGNSATGLNTDGGGIGNVDAGSDDVDITVTNSTLSGNRATDRGGAIANTNGDIYVNNSTITDNQVRGYDAEGGGIGNSEGNITITDSTITGNRAIGEANAAQSSSVDAEGGGVRNSAGDITITNSVISDNLAEIDGGDTVDSGDAEGGGVRNSGGNTIITGSTISNNRVVVDGQTTTSGLDAEGGGIRNSGGTITVTNSSVTGNSVFVAESSIGTTLEVEGGGIRISGGDITVINSTVAHNTIDEGANTVGTTTDIEGGGLRAYGGTISLTNSTITGNYSSGVGGGLAVGDEAGSLTLANALVLGNGAGTSDNEIFIDPLATQTENAPSLVGTMLYDGIGGSVALPGTVADVAQGVFVATSTFADVNNNGVQDGLEPTLGANIAGGIVGDNGGDVLTAAIVAGGPAADAGDQAAALDDQGAPLTTDARGAGFARVDGADVDLGAFEEQASDSAGNFIVTTELDEAFDGGSLAAEMADGDGLSLREALGLANLNPATLDTITFADGPGEAFGPGAYNAINLTLGELSIAGSVDIQGAGNVRIDSNEANRIFNIDDGNDGVNSTVTISGVRLTGARDVGAGGAVLNREDLGLYDFGIFDPRLTGNSTSIYGAGIANIGTGDLTIVDSQISDADANAGGTDGRAFGGGIAHLSSGTLTLDNVVIRFSDARGNNSEGNAYGGGLFFNDGDVVIEDSIFERNTVESEDESFGGAISGQGNSISITRSEIYENEADSGNNRSSYGGGLSLNGGTVNISYSTIRDNTVTAGDKGYGAGAFFSGSDGFTIERSTISGNTAIGNLEGGRGGGILSDTDGLAVQNTISNSTISGNEANVFGGGVLNFGGSLSITNSTITDNDDGVSSGGDGATISTEITSSIVAGNADSDVQALYGDITFSSGGNNLIGNGDDGNGVFVDGVDGDIVGTAIAPVDPLIGPLQLNGGPTETHALLAGSQALNNGANPDGLVTDQRGAARDDGGGTDIGAFEDQPANPGPLVVTTLADEDFNGGTLADEIADGDGLSLREAIAIANTDNAVINSILFAGDVDDVSGLTLLAADGITDVTGVGGTINLAADLDDILISSSLNIDGDLNNDGTADITIDADSADGLNDADSRIFTIDGGATVQGATIYGVPVEVGLNGLTIRDGIADEGGGILVERGNQLVLSDSVITGNTASESEGGGISGERLSQISVTNTLFTDNEAEFNGGGLEIEDGGILTIVGSTFDGNVSGNDGGGLFHDGNAGDVAFPGVVTIVDSVFINNIASAPYGNGGAFEAEDRSIVNVIGSIFDNNYAGDEGGAIYHDGGSSTQPGVLNIFNSSITNNGASDYGGGIGTGTRTNITLVNTTLANNVTPGFGGGIFLEDQSTARIVNSTISGNLGSYGGGLYVETDAGYQGGTVTVANSIIAGNHALYTGNDLFAQADDATLMGDGFSILGSMPVGFGENLGANGLVLGDGNAFTLADIFDTVVGLDPDGIPASGDEFDAGLLADNGGPNGLSVLLNSNDGNPALDAGDDIVSLGITIDETVIGFDVNGDGDATDTNIDDIGDFLFDQRDAGFDRFSDQPGVANNGANTVDLGALEVQDAVVAGPIELALIDTDTDTVLAIIEDGDDIPLALVQGRNVTLSATVPATSPLFGQVEAMFLNFNNGQATRGETVEPYALFGDDTAGDFFDGTMLQLGGQTISLDLFSDDARNNLLDTVEINFTVVDAPNEAPEIVSADNNAVNENQTFAIDVQSTDDNDSEGNGLTYEIIGGGDAAEFTIDEDTGVLSFINAPDFENPTDTNTNNVYEVEVRVTDSDGETDEQEISITVEDVNDVNLAPQITSADDPAVNENQTFAIDVQSIDDNDSEGNGLTYEIFDGSDAAAFDIDPDTGVLTFKNAPDFENPGDDDGNNVYEVTVKVTDSGGEMTTQAINVTVEDVDETIQPLVELALVDTDTDQVITTIMNGDAIPLALVQGRNVSLSATVPNTSPLFGQVESMFLDFNNGDVTRGETVEPYALFGDDTAGDFFGGTMLGLGGQTISLDLFSDDARNNLLDTVDFDFTIVDGPNEDPEIVSPNANTVNENQTFAINVQSNDDRDSEGNGLTYSIIGGDDGGLFSIDEDTGVLSFNAAPDFENPTDDNTDNIYNVEVEVEDSGGLTDTQTINITVDDVDETPQAIAEIGIYDTDTNALITLIQDGDVFPVGLFNGNEDDLTIGVVIPNSSPLFGQVESVFLDLNDGQVTRTEDAEIYALSGDVNGDFFDGRDLTGDNTIELEFYSSDQRRGDLLETLEIDFTIDDSIIP